MSTFTTFDPDKWYVLRLFVSDLSRAKILGSVANNYAAGEAVYTSTSFVWTKDTSIEDLYFQLNDVSGTPPPPPASSITLLTPTSTTVADFQQWEVSYTNTTTTAGRTKVGVIYTTFSDTNVYVDFSLSTTTASSTSFFISKNRAIPLNEQWSASAVLYFNPGDFPFDISSTTTVLASSTVTSFTLTRSIGGTLFQLPTSTTSTYSMSCDPDANTFAFSICYVMQYLFSPKTSDFDVFTRVYNEIKNKPPFGYFGAISPIISGFSTTTTSTVQMPDFSGMSTPFNAIKTTLSVILWIVFGFWIFHKFRNIQL
jgi:hypothetical protein